MQTFFVNQNNLCHSTMLNAQYTIGVRKAKLGWCAKNMRTAEVVRAAALFIAKDLHFPFSTHPSNSPDHSLTLYILSRAQSLIILILFYPLSDFSFLRPEVSFPFLSLSVPPFYISFFDSNTVRLIHEDQDRSCRSIPGGINWGPHYPMSY